MITSAALLLAAVLSASGPARAATDPAAYDAKAAPLDDLSKELLTGNGYEIHDDGQVWDKIGEAPVMQTDMPYLLSRLASAKRLGALLAINNIITRYDAERNLTPEDREAVRVIVRQNWVVFGSVPRGDFRSYFSAEELEVLDQIPPRFEAMGAISMTDPAIESVTAAPPPAKAAAAPSVTALPPAAAAVPPSITALPPVAAPVPAPPPAAPQAPAAVASVAAIAPAIVIPTLTPMMELPSLSRGSPFTPAAAAAAPAAAPSAVISPVVPPSFKEEPAAPPTLPMIVAAPAAPSTASVVSSNLGSAKAWTPPAAYTAAIAAQQLAVSTHAAPPPVAAPVPEPPKAAVVGEAEYLTFVADGPYNKEGKGVLELIEKRAPDFCLPLLRRTVVGAVPQIVSDGTRTGAELRAGFTRDAANPLAPPLVALSPGPVFVEVKKSMFGSRDAVLLPESAQAWTELGVARPPLDALRENASPVSTQNGDWGAVRVYADGSRRGSYSTTEMAGELLEQLLLLGLAREGLDASAYAARHWARTARLMFYSRMKDEMQQDNFLDPDRRAELRGWLDQPDEADDLTAASWSGSRRRLLDPRRGPPGAALDFEARAREACVRSTLEDALAENSRRRAARVGELETLVDAGVLDGDGAKPAAQSATDAEEAARRRLLAAPPACPAADPARAEGLRKAVLLMAESTRAEHLMRERKAGVDSHAL
jgi:hypothetical protein